MRKAIFRIFVVVLAGFVFSPADSSGQTSSYQDCVNSSDCLCYEPLNADDGPFSDSVSYDPSDTTTKECGTVYIEGGGDTVISIPGQSSLDMPGSGVTYVWQFQQDGTRDSHVGDGMNVSINPGETLCVAGYERANFNTLSSTQRARISRFGTASGAQSVTQWWFGVSQPYFRMTNVMSGADQNCNGKSGSATVTLDDANSSWIRYEHCLDLNSSGTLFFRARARVLDTGATYETACDQTGSASSGLTFNQFWPGNVFSQGGNSGWLRWKSHVSAWKVSFNQNFWPPTAWEVEDAGQSSPNGGALLLDGVKIE